MKVLLKSAHATSDVGLLELAGVTPADAERFASAKIAFLSTSAELDPVDASNPSTRANALLVVGFGCEARAPIMTGNPVLASATAGKTLKKERCALAMKPDAREIVCSLFASPDGRDPARTPGLCEGDSGGPLFLRAGNSLAVVAVSSAYQADGTSRFVRVDAPSALGGWVASMTAPPVSGPSQGR